MSITPAPTFPAGAQVLVAHDLGQPRDGRPAPALAALLARLEAYEPGAVIAVFTVDEQTYGQPDGVTHPVHYVVFDALALRNTEAHGIGYRTGFVSSISQVSDVEEQARLQGRPSPLR